MARKPIVFISYAHKDEPDESGVLWCTYVAGFLKAAFPNDGAEIWLDGLIEGGGNWSAEIERKLRGCDAFLLLVSRHSLTSDFIVNREIETIRARQKKGESVLLYPLLLTPTPRASLGLIDAAQIRPSKDKPLSSFDLYARAQKVTEAADEIAEIVARGAETLARAIEVRDRDSLKAWLERRPREDAVIIAVRAALRVLPLYRSSLSKSSGFEEAQRFSNWTLSLFRVGSLAWVGAVSPVRAGAFHVDAIRALDAVIVDCAAAQLAASRVADKLATLAPRVAAAVAAAVEIVLVSDAAQAAVDAIMAAADAVVIDVASRNSPDADALWRAVRGDIEALTEGSWLAGEALWPKGAPTWAEDAWYTMRQLLRTTENWQDWFDWYDERLKGVVRSEAYEFAFLDWPENLWQQGPRVINPLIHERLNKLGDNPLPSLPGAVPGVEKPVSYDWNASNRIDPQPGAQNLASFSLPTGEEDKRAALDRCRSSARRLLHALRSSNVFSVAASYEIHLHDYLEDLPTEAGQGDIVLAHDRMMNLAAMLDHDRAKLDPHFVIQLEGVVQNHRALDPFYEIIQRLTEAAAHSKWTMAFPHDAARAFAGDVAGTPEIFEPNVGAGLRRVEEAGPPVAPAPASPVPAEPAATSSLGETQSRAHQRQFAAVINSLWGTFLKGPQVIGASQAWVEAAHKLSGSVEPVLAWLRSLGA